MDSEEIKKELAYDFSKTFDKLVTDEIKEKRANGIPFYEKNIYEKMGISKGAFNFYKNGNDGSGIDAKVKVPDLVALYKIKQYFDVPYSYLLNETKTKNIDSINAGIGLGLNDDAIKHLNILNNDKVNVDKEFELYIINCLLSNEEFIHRLSGIVIAKLSRRIANAKYKKLELNHDENSDYILFQKYKLYL